MYIVYIYIYTRFYKQCFFSTQPQCCQKQSPEVFCKKGVLRNFAKFTGKHLYPSLLFNKVAGFRPAEACNFFKKENLAQVFSCEFCEISKNTFSYRTPPVAASLFLNCFMN